jgi:hypothetical protein
MQQHRERNHETTSADSVHLNKSFLCVCEETDRQQGPGEKTNTQPVHTALSSLVEGDVVHKSRHPDSGTYQPNLKVRLQMHHSVSGSLNSPKNHHHHWHQEHEPDPYPNQLHGSNPLSNPLVVHTQFLNSQSSECFFSPELTIHVINSSIYDLCEVACREKQTQRRWRHCSVLEGFFCERHFWIVLQVLQPWRCGLNATCQTTLAL